MFYCKENLFAEFEVAKSKDLKGKKEKYDNRIQFFKDHIELRKNHPEYYDGIDIMFDCNDLDPNSHMDVDGDGFSTCDGDFDDNDANYECYCKSPEKILNYNQSDP